MFYVVELEKDLDVHPRFFGKDLRETVTKKLHQEVEGTCNGKYGYVIAVTNIFNMGQGMVRKDGTGLATFPVKYQCIVFRPFKGEVMDCVVTSVNKMGFFAEAGPVNVFVSNHLIPEEYEFNSSGDPCYTSSTDTLAIKEGADIRLRVVGAKIDPAEIFCIGTIKDDYLGVLNQGVPLS